jgi:hypothetical protein
MKNKYVCLSLCLLSLWLAACVTGNTQEMRKINLPQKFEITER